ncbi:MAG: DUF368 domain-containing protein [Spirochaetaceae bacterium]|jgi:putative membrane protein|nr:DUF368 domain-containing protein [Spirochaetaceae bacterium]
MINAIKLFAVGIMFGIAVIIPGVSGGTIAVVFNIYDRLLAVITPSVRKILSQWKFWLPLGIGTAAGILLLSKMIEYFLDKYPAQTGCLFIGMILGSLPLIYAKVRKPNSVFMPLSATICFIVSIIVMFCMTFIKLPESRTVFTNLDPATCVLLFVAGLLSAIAMIIPGISGSFLLIAMGLFFTINNTVAALLDPILIIAKGGEISNAIAALQRPVLTLIPFGIGVLAGLFVGAALVRFLMKKVPSQTYGAIIGLVIGSTFVIYPVGSFDNVATITTSVICAAIGVVISLLFS